MGKRKRRLAANMQKETKTSRSSKKSVELFDLSEVKDVEDEVALEKPNKVVDIEQVVPPKKPCFRHSNSGSWVVSNLSPDAADRDLCEIIDEPTVDVSNNVDDYDIFDVIESAAAAAGSSNRTDEDLNNNKNGDVIILGEKEKKPVKNANPQLHVYTIDEETLLVLLRKEDVLTIHGKVEAQCIWGTVNCLGHIMTCNKPPCNIYSPDCGGLMTVSVVSTRELSLAKIRKKYHGLDKSDLKKSIELFGTSLAGVTLKHLPCKKSEFITKISPFQTMYSARIVSIQMKWYPETESFLAVTPSTAGLKFSSDHLNAVEQFVTSVSDESSPVVAVCGGKNAGKSTLNRYIVNSSLQKCNEIAYLDCDIGQTEFTAPGCISLTLVTQPLLGPAFTHQQKPLRSCFVGLVSPSDNVPHYLKCLTYVFQAYKGLSGKKPPLVVNTMGWISGLGLNILAETLRLVKPNIVIQLNIGNQRMPSIDASFTATTPSFQALNEHSTNYPFYDVEEHKLITIAVQPQGNRGLQKYSPANQRTLNLLAYLANIYSNSESQNLGPIYNWPTYRRPWNSLALHVCHLKVPNSQIMYALNGSIVALCTADSKQMLVPRDALLPKFFAKSPVCSCLGFGLVRAIDPEAKLFHILTPVTSDDLIKVNCLLKGLVDLPEAMIREQPGVAENAFPPYVEFVARHHGARVIKERRHLLRKRSQT